MPAYSTAQDLMIGNVPLPAYIDASQAIQSAADEIDAVLGMTYVTPIQITDTPSTRASRLILKKANAMLSSGRIIMAMDAGGQDTDLHKYGRYLIGEAEKIVQAIASGQVPLVGAVRLPGVSDAGSAPVIINQDTDSNVNSFYDHFTPKCYPFPRSAWPWWS